MSTLLRRYEPNECGDDGYPLAWDLELARINWAGPKVAGHYEECISPAIKDYVREQAGHRCLRCGHPYPPGTADRHPRGEWTPCDEHCTHGPPARWREGAVGGEWRPYDHVLTVGESIMDDGPGGQRIARWQVEAHWRILTVHHLDEDKANCCWWNLASLCQRCHLRMQRAVVMGRPYHYEHSEWFKPFAAGFYAWKYLGEDLTREQVAERLDELLALERRFTQEVLL